MKIVLLGNGRMGQTIARLAASKGHQIVSVFDEHRPLTESSDLREAEVMMDFSIATAVPHHMRLAAHHHLPLVEGTTGWRMEQILLTEMPDLTMVYSPNFSIGIYLFNRIIAFAGRLIGQCGGYDCYVHEWHHRGKADSPSGTALLLANQLLHAIPEKKGIEVETSHQPLAADSIHVTSTRAGRIPGTHEVGFDSEWDQIVFRHISFGREGFAMGALLAAELILNRKGIYSFNDLLRDAFK